MSTTNSTTATTSSTDTTTSSPTTSTDTNTSASTTSSPTDTSTSLTNSSSDSTPTSSNSSSIVTTPLTTAVATTIIITSNGQPMTVTTQTSITLAAGSTVTPKGSNNSSGSSNHTGAIVGGAVGGAAFLAILVVFVLMCLRRERQKRLEKVFDGNFDPDHTSTTTGTTFHDKPRKGAPAGTLPDVGVDVDNEDDGMGGRLNGTSIGGGVISPYMLGQTPSHSQYQPSHPPSSYNPQQQLHQHYGGPPESIYSGSDGGTYASPSTMGSYYPTHQQPLPNPHDYPAALRPGMMMGMRPASPANTASTSNAPTSVTSARMAKEREAMGGRPGGFSLAKPDGPNASSVVVHQDAGRVPQEDRETNETEIPPTYESIPKT